MLPRMDSVEEVREAVRHLRYPPDGDRGVATYNRACRFGLDPGALDRANQELLGVVQIESARAVEQAAAIAAPPPTMARRAGCSSLMGPQPPRNGLRAGPLSLSAPTRPYSPPPWLPSSAGRDRRTDRRAGSEGR
jgi:hypothetical protein